MEKKDEKEVVKRPMENYEDDLIVYATERLCDTTTTDDDKEMTKDLIYHATHILWQLDFKQTCGFMANVEDLMDEFGERFGGKYESVVCDCCQEKLDNGELDP